MPKGEHSSKIHPKIPEKPGNDDNWVDRRGGLDPYLRRIAKHLISDQGYSRSRAIATAWNTLKKWARGVNHDGSKVSAKTQAKAAKSVANMAQKAARS